MLFHRPFLTSLCGVFSKPAIWAMVGVSTLLHSRSLVADTPVFSTVAITSPSANVQPNNLVQAADGNFYGTTRYGGDASLGSICRLTPGGALTVLHVFSGADGSHPIAALLQAADGNFYGSTADGGAHGYGTLFRLTPAGVLTTLYAFNGYDGSLATDPLVQAADGNFYGTTYFGGDFYNDPDAVSQGIFFRLTPLGEFTVLYRFSGGKDGGQPSGLVYIKALGTFYGTTQYGGDQSRGTIFAANASGQLETLHRFTFEEGGNPAAPLTLGSDGALYGTASGAPGTVFRLKPDGTFATLHALTDAEGFDPQGTLLQAADGYFYGVARVGGVNNRGTIFRLAMDGNFQVLRSLVEADGSYPIAPLVQATDGSFYGTTDGSNLSGGTVFRFRLLAATPTPTVTVAPATGSIYAGGSKQDAFVVNLSNPLDKALKVAYSVGGSAVAGQDYGSLKGTVKIKPGETSRTIRLKPIKGLNGALSRTVKVKLLPGTDYVVGTDKKAKLKLTTED